MQAKITIAVCSVFDVSKNQSIQNIDLFFVVKSLLFVHAKALKIPALISHKSRREKSCNNYLSTWFDIETELCHVGHA